jgi:hypothetical protein
MPGLLFQLCPDSVWWWCGEYATGINLRARTVVAAARGSCVDVHVCVRAFQLRLWWLGVQSAGGRAA